MTRGVSMEAHQVMIGDFFNTIHPLQPCKLTHCTRGAIPLAYRTVLTRAVFRSRVAGHAVQVLRERGGMLWPPTHQRVEHAMAMAPGRTVQETQPAGAASREIA